MNNITQQEYHKVYAEQTEEIIEKHKINAACLSTDVETFTKEYIEASNLLKLIADKYQIPEAKAYFNDTSK